MNTPVTKPSETMPAWMTGALAVVAVVVLLAWSPAYVSHLLVMLGIYLLLAYSLNLITGLGGLILFCHAVFYGIGPMPTRSCGCRREWAGRRRGAFVDGEHRLASGGAFGWGLERAFGGGDWLGLPALSR
jgi:hypothetical protein